MEHQDHLDELRDAPILAGLSKDDPFVAPDGFFDRFPHAVQARIAAEKRVGFDWSAWLHPLSIAGALVAFTLVIAFWQFWPEPTKLAVSNGTIIEPEELPQGTWDTDVLYDELGHEGFSTIMDLPADADVLYAYLDNEDLALDLLTEDL